MKAPQGCGQVFNVLSRIPKRVSRRKSPCLIPYMTGVWKVIERRDPMIVCNARVWEISEPKSQAGVFNTIERSNRRPAEFARNDQGTLGLSPDLVET